jgi:dimethylaniline monooxygenase (N-oxide forming)
VKYFDLYGEQFQYEKYVRFRHRIVKLEPNDDYEETGKWKVTAKNLNIEEEITEVFDGVMVCTGHHVQPLIPEFKDQDKYRGKIMHTHSYKKPDGFENKKVVVIGIGNSGGDAVVELSTVAEKVKHKLCLEYNINGN